MTRKRQALREVSAAAIVGCNMGAVHNRRKTFGEGCRVLLINIE
jgi:hypothetical protein